jgi:predicted small lipoprotein YifL
MMTMVALQLVIIVSCGQKVPLLKRPADKMIPYISANML